MKMFEEWKSARKSKKLTLKRIDAEIEKASQAENGFVKTDPKTGKSEAMNVSELMDIRRKAKMNGVETGEVLKVIANVAIVVAIVGFEMFSVMNAKASRFIKTL